MPAKLTQDRVEARLERLGFELLEPYIDNRIPTLVRCLAHNEQHRADLGGIMSCGKGLSCCKAAKLRAANLGKKQPQEAKDRVGAFFREFFKTNPHPQLGKKRRPETLERLRISHLGFVKELKSVMGTAARGKTGGKPGHFYIARHPQGWLKFGSTTTGIKSRFEALRYKDGVTYSLVLCAVVPDAGAYEAAMMERYREHWIRGERFRDFLAA